MTYERRNWRHRAWCGVRYGQDVPCTCADAPVGSSKGVSAAAFRLRPGKRPAKKHAPDSVVESLHES